MADPPIHLISFLAGSLTKYQHVLAYYKDAFGFPQSIMDVLAN